MLRNTFIDFVGEVEMLHPSQYGSLLAQATGSKHAAKAFIDDYVSAVGRFDLSAGRSHIHNNGFLKLSLWRQSSTGASVRMHVWRQREATKTQRASVHDHRWDFSSSLLAGRLKFVNYDAQPDLSGAWVRHRVGDANSDGEKPSMLEGNCSLLQTSAYELFPGAVHSLDHRQLHSTPPPDTFAVTIVVTAPPARTYSHILTEQGSTREGNFSSARALTLDQVVPEISTVATLIDGR